MCLLNPVEKWQWATTQQVLRSMTFEETKRGLRKQKSILNNLRLNKT